MAKVIEIGIASEGEAYRRGIESDVIKPTEDAEKSLKEFAKQGDKAGDEIEQAMRTAQKESDRARSDIEKLGDEIVQASRKSRAMGGDTKHGMGEASNAVEEFSDEARQNLSETVSSFRGDVEDIPQIMQDILGGVSSNLGVAGMALGAGGAAAIGMFVAGLQEAAEKAEELRQKSNELALEIVEAGGSLDRVEMSDRLKEWALELRDNKEWWEIWQESAITNLDAVDNALKYTSRSGQQLFDAMSGQDPRAALDLLEEFEQRSKDLAKELRNVSSIETGYQDRENALKAEIKALDDVSEAIREQQELQGMSADTARELLKYTEAQAAADEAAAAATQRRTDAVNSLQGELDESVASYNEFIDAETGAVDPAAYIAAMQARMDATTNFNTNLEQLAANTGLSFEAQQAILDQGVEFAPMLASIMAGGSEMQAQYAAQMEAMVSGGQAILDGTEPTVTVTATADAQDAERQLAATAEERTAPVKAEANTAPAEKALDAAAAKPRTATIAATVDLSAAEAALTRFINRQRVTTVTVEARTREGQLVP